MKDTVFYWDERRSVGIRWWYYATQVCAVRLMVRYNDSRKIELINVPENIREFVLTMVKTEMTELSFNSLINF